MRTRSAPGGNENFCFVEVDCGIVFQVAKIAGNRFYFYCERSGPEKEELARLLSIRRRIRHFLKVCKQLFQSKSKFGVTGSLGKLGGYVDYEN